LQTTDYEAEQAAIIEKAAVPLPEGSGSGIHSRCSGGVWGSAPLKTANPVYFLPYLSGERTPHNDPLARGAFVGMNTTTTRADMTQAVMEGVTFSLRDILERVRELGANVQTARIIGGGAKSPLWCQMTADILRLKVEKIQTGEGPAFGAAILAMVGAGAFATVEEACTKLITVSESYLPNENTAALYDKCYPIYKNLYDALRPSFTDIGNR